MPQEQAYNSWFRNQNARNRRTAGSRNQNIDDGPALVNILSERIPKYHPYLALKVTTSVDNLRTLSGSARRTGCSRSGDVGASITSKSSFPSGRNIAGGR